MPLYQRLKRLLNAAKSACLRQATMRAGSCAGIRVFFCRHMAAVPGPSIIFFPCGSGRLYCGLAGIVAFKRVQRKQAVIDSAALAQAAAVLETRDMSSCRGAKSSFHDIYLGGNAAVENLCTAVRTLKQTDYFIALFRDPSIQRDLAEISSRLAELVSRETAAFSDAAGILPSPDAAAAADRIETLRDIVWCIDREILENILKIQTLAGRPTPALSDNAILLYRQINAVLNSIDRLEVRGRDSAGISLLCTLSGQSYADFLERLKKENISDQFERRTRWSILKNNCIAVHAYRNKQGDSSASIAFTYKVAAEIGSLGDNVAFLRTQITGDPILRVMIDQPIENHTLCAHTRWASVGAISESNCHPVDNESTACAMGGRGIIHACLNGDIDNYQQLKRRYEGSGNTVPEDITTDTKIIPLHITHYLAQGFDIQEAFRLAVNDFEGSHAIIMHTDLAPGRLFLAQRGSGQAIFIGMGDDYCMPASEVYGFVEETQRFFKLDAQKASGGKSGTAAGQIVILDQNAPAGREGIRSMLYDGTLLQLTEADIQRTAITSRDIDRQGFTHYFLKEISEAPASVEKTLHNRWTINAADRRVCEIMLDETVMPDFLKKDLLENRIRRIFFVGQGTAGVAALACANILNYYMNDPGLQVGSLKSSELSGFALQDAPDSMADSLTIAITQSGTTTDTNRTVDMVRSRGGRTIAIVNRRDSDITFKVDGVMYTSSGRDIEMSVASTKAFYAQIVAGALLSLYIARLKGRRDGAFVTGELRQLLALPGHMRSILKLQPQIEQSARRLAPVRTYWATVGSGPNKASADEIRIKLSELCYKTISSDFVEDKKHIDLSSEPLILICAAGTRGTVIGDIIKDTAIFQAHKAAPVVIANEGETRFAPYAEDVFHVPAVAEHLAPVVNTLAGHLWGYYAALAINDGSRFLHEQREAIQTMIDRYAAEGLDVYEVVLHESFREKIAAFYAAFQSRRAERRFPSIMGLETAANLTLLLKYLSGRLPLADFDLDFKIAGTPRNMLKKLFECMSEAINCMARPVDAIKHQAKTVTVGTSRIIEHLEGILFDALAENGIATARITGKNIIVLRNLQSIIAAVKGSTLYRIAHLNLFGEPTDETTIEVVRKTGEVQSVPSRVERDTRLVGTKRIIAREGNVYIGRGLKDGRSIVVIPVMPDATTSAAPIEYMLLLHIAFKDRIDLATKRKALGGKYERIKNIVQERSVEWDDRMLDRVDTPELFGSSAEKIADSIVAGAQDAL